MAPDLAKDGAAVDVGEAVAGLLAGVEARYCFGPSWRVLLVHGVGMLRVRAVVPLGHLLGMMGNSSVITACLRPYLRTEF